jgi:hypothetical protein
MKSHIQRPIARVACALACAAVATMAAPTARAEDQGRSFTIYGFAMADYIQDFTGRLSPAWDDAFRPSKIGIDGQYGTDGQASVSAKQSRFGVKGSIPTGADSAPLNFKFEFDLFGTGVDEGQTTMRLRHFYGEWGQFLAGKTHSLFMDIDVFPNVIDYWGPPGMVFFRNLQFRWTPYKTDHSHFAIAIEDPYNDVDSGSIRLIEGFSDAQVQSDQQVPDFTAQWRTEGSWGHVLAGGILRRIGYEFRQFSSDPWRSGSKTGWGINLASGIKTIGRDQLLLQVVYGEGIANYMNDGGMDLAPQASFTAGDLTALTGKAVPLTGIVAYYDHYWNSKWSSSIGYSYTQVDNTNFQDPGAFHKGDYASGNLLFYPGDNLMFGGELMWGKRTNNDGASDDDIRFQFSAKYSFDVKL